MSAPPRWCWSPSISSIRTASSIRYGTGTVGFRADRPGEWHSPVILKLPIVVDQALPYGWFLGPTPLAPQRWEHCRLWLAQIRGQCLYFLFFGRALPLVSQPVAVYHLSHSITSAAGSLLPEVSHLIILCFHSS